MVSVKNAVNAIFNNNRSLVAVNSKRPPYKVINNPDKSVTVQKEIVKRYAHNQPDPNFGLEPKGTYGR